ncbi:MAG TPA: protein-methionine-sulfoxide reductase catalytic subunit MsrP [Alphaproteobacteria bacterium]|nr:protein-methionine-sulfoxide reductase catalytic subunit MsrP [Alphaproteobacteria bacterium]
MLIKRRPGWAMKEQDATPEAVFAERRRLVKAIAAGPILAPAILAALAGRADAFTPEPDPSAGLYPFKRNPRYTLDRAITPEEDVETYNNYYEFGSQKDIWRAAQAVKLRPWTIKIDGMVAKPKTVDIDTLLKQMPLEERLYRHRCVEAWSIAVPWSGFALKSFVDFAEPLSSAQYIVFQTFQDPGIAPGQREFWYPWPYIEGLTMAEATNELAFIATGLYGKPMLKQNGAPLRLVVPWKYGFKSAKAFIRVSFTDKRPKTFWETIDSHEYGFWANVNPQVPHPRWSQAMERVIGTNERVPTQIFNGYGAYVADIYKDLKNERLFA